MTYSEAISYLNSRSAAGIRFGLERVKNLLTLFGNPEARLPAIHVAGTNGKGSTANYLENILRTSGLKTGIFTSPFIDKPTEMIRINGQPVSEEAFAELIGEASLYNARLDATPEGGASEYETYTATALAFFMRQKCDIVIIEVCMGGRLDCTNILERVEAHIITKISLDHTGFLGDTLEQIARHKAGIIRCEAPVITWPQESRAMVPIRLEAAKCYAPVIVAALEQLEMRFVDVTGLTFDFQELKGLKIAVPAPYMAQNAVVALTAARELAKKGWPVTEKSIKEGLLITCWPGRFELLSREPDFFLDCCHNPDGAIAFTQAYKFLQGEKKAVVLLGVMGDKDYNAMASTLSEIAEAFVLLPPSNSRALKQDKLKQCVSRYCDKVFTSDTINAAVTKSLTLATKTGIICALGSHFHAAEIRKNVQRSSLC